MASTYSTDLKLELMITGENAGTWGEKTNTNLNLLQQAIAGYQAVSIAGGAQTTALVMSNAEISNARNAVIKLTGTITGNQIVTVPTGIEKTYIVSNGTVGAFTVQFIQAGGTGVTFATTDKSTKILFADGTNIVDTGTVSETGIQTLTNKTLTSPIINEIDDANSNEQIKFTATASAVNEFTVTNAATGNAPEISATGGDTNIDLKITPKGSGKINLDGIKFPNADGSNGQVLSTDGAGSLAFTTISSNPTQLVQSETLATAVSYTAGQLASIGASGEIVALPTLNTFGTTRTNASAVAYSGVGDNGNTAAKVAITTNTNTNKTITISGTAISNSANPTNGGTTITDTITSGNFFQSYFSSSLISLSDTKYLVFNGSTFGGDDCGTRGGKFNVFVASVDSTTGNVTKGNVLSFANSWPGSSVAVTALEAARITQDIVYFRYANNVPGADFTGVITISGTTSTYTQDTDASAFSGADGKSTILTSNNILGYGTGASWKTATYTPSPIGVGTVTTTAQVADYLSNGTWGKMCALGTSAAEYVLTTYTNTSGAARYITYSVNQTTGALTQVETGLQTIINSNAASSMVFKDKDNFIGSNSSFSFTNGVANTPTFNAPYTFGTMRYNSSDLFYSFATSLTSFPTNTGYTVVAYGTNSFNYIGVAKETDSSSPINIVTDGVAANFTSLTPGTVYYATTPADGTVTTSSASGILIGKAISTTEILLQRSNTQ
jgi:hypothetical protein